MVGRFIVVTMWAVCMAVSLVIAALAIFIVIESVGAYNTLVFLIAITSPLMMWIIGKEGEKEGYGSYLQSFISFFTGWGQAIRELKARGCLHNGPEPRPVQCAGCGMCSELIPLYIASDGLCKNCVESSLTRCDSCGEFKDLTEFKPGHGLECRTCRNIDGID